MKKKTREEFIEEVRAEIEHIKTNAKKKEIAKLDFLHFSFCSPWRCIYGQMTGDCRSPRAKKLYPKKYVYTGSSGAGGRIPFSKQSFVEREDENNFTPLEKYLYIVKTKTHENIIAYLKGEVETLELI